MTKYLLCVAMLYWCCTHSLQAQVTSFSPEKGMVALSPLGNKKINLKVGQKAYVQYKQHGSVGLSGEATSSNENILKTLREETHAHQVQQPGMTGGDAATVTVVFEAIAVGEAVVTTTELFRGTRKDLGKARVRVR